VDFWTQGGFESRDKIDPRRHREKDAKKKGAWMAEKSQGGAPTSLECRSPEPRGGIPWTGQ